MPSRNQSLLCACLVLAAVMAWMLHQPPVADHAVASPDMRARQIDHASVFRPETLPVEHREKPAELSMPVTEDFLQNILTSDKAGVVIPLPGGERVSGTVRKIRRDENGVLMLEGDITRPEAGRFYFQRQTIVGKAGALFGFIHFDQSETAWQVWPSGENGAPQLVRTTVDKLMCRAFAAPPEVSQIPATHPTNDPVPPGENGVIQLQSLPGAAAVVYLDFDGEQRDFDYWGNINAAPSGASNTQIFEVWQGVCEDFTPFNINVTTIRAVYEAALPGHRMQVIVTPTNTAQPGAGGVAVTGSFNNTGEIVCWSFSTTGKNAVEVISHEVGHTLGLSHDGQLPSTEYYAGHGNATTGWAPIMGVGYARPVTQWSKGEYSNANNPQDDLQIISNNNNGVAYRGDDHGQSTTSASALNIDSSGLVSNEGIIETNTDRDSFRFSTTGGTINLQVHPVPPIASSVAVANLDVRAELVQITSSLTTVIPTIDLLGNLSYSFSQFLDPGDYMVRIRGASRANPLVGYTNYASLGSYTVTGSVDGGVHSEHFTIVENSPNNTVVGTVLPRVFHDNGTLLYQLSGGSGAFSIDSSNGQITVANSALLDFESRSSRWDDPADFEFSVIVSDSKDYAVETIRTVVNLTDLNEPPLVPPPPAIAMPERSLAGAYAATVAATDADRADFVTYSITAGNTGGAFAIHPATGVVTVAGTLNHSITPSYQLTIRASDQRAPVNHVDATLDIQIIPLPAGYDPGSVVRTFFSEISGGSVDDLTNSPNFPNKPDSEVILSSFDGGAGHGSEYGSTIRGYLIAPATGNYTFWISANDSARLFISTDDNPQNATLRAGINTPAAPGQWDLEPGQQSAVIPLTAGGIYFIEARHKQAFGGDHLQVAWQGPGMAAKQIIPGTWLAPFRQQYAPWAPPQTFGVRDSSAAGTFVGRISFIEPNLNEETVSYAITGGNALGNFTIDPVTGDIDVAVGAVLTAGSSHVLTISATDDGTPAATGEATATIQVKRLDEGLHAWWKLDETSGTTARDSSGNLRDANLTGGGAWIARGDANAALELNGADARLSRYDFESLSGNTPFTVAAWVRVPATHGSEGVLFHQSTGVINGEDRSLRVSVTAGGNVRFRVHARNVNLLTETDQFDITTTQTIHDGTWHHVACVRDGTTGRIFIDGVESVSGSGPVLAFDTDAYTAIGRNALDNSDYLEAAVDDVRVYAEALTAPQLVRIAGAPKVAITAPSAASAVIPPGVGLLMEAAASDPNGPAPSITWSQVSGPGAAVFGSPATAETTVLFPTGGTYLLRATASDGVDDVSSTITVLAGNTASSSFAGFAYGAGTSGSFANLTTNVYDIQGTSTGISNGATDDGFYLLGQSFTGDFDVRARVSAALDDGFGDPWGMAGMVVRAGTAGQADEAGAFIGYNSPGGHGTWIRRLTAGAANVETTYPGMPLPQWCRMTRTADTLEFWHSADGTSWISRGTMTLPGEIRAGLCWSSISQFTSGSALFENVSGFTTSNVGPAVSAGADFPAQTTLSAPLAGQSSDDGLPAPPAATMVSWELLSGPGTVDIANPSQATTAAVFSQAGVYQLRLIADDGALRTFDDVTVAVTDPPPVVSVAATTPDAAETGPVNGTFTFTRSVWLEGDITVNYVLSGSSDNGTDYALISDSILMPDDAASVTLDVVPLSDEGVEGPETVVLTLVPGSYVISGDPAVVTIEDSNHPPSFPVSPLVAADAQEDLPYNGSVAGTATDPDAGDTLDYSVTSGPAWLALAEDGTLSGTPGNGDVGLNSFTVRATDPDGAFAEIQLGIVVLNVNDPPAFTADPISGTDATEDSPYSGSLASSASDPDTGDTREFTKINGPAWLAVALDGTLSGTPENSDVGANTFTVRVTDLAGEFDEAQFSITVLNTNDPPAFTADPVAGTDATEDSPYSGSLASSASDPDTGDTREFTKINGPAWLAVALDGTLSGTPENSDVGANTFTVRVTDLAGEFDEAQFNITVLNTNDPPEFTADPIAGTDATALSVYNGTLAASAGDPDAGDALVFAKTAGPAWLVVNPDGSLSGTPAESDEGPNQFVVSVTDALNAVDSATLQITVLPPPVINVVASDSTASETGLQTGAFTITRSGSTTGDLTVNFTLTGTAINGVDYVNIPNSIVIPDGDASVIINVTPATDELIEGTEGVRLALQQGPYETATPSFAFVYIRDSNHAPFFLSDPVVAPAALADVSYTGESLADLAGDPNLDAGDTLTFEKLAGPAWLTIATSGTLSGLPGAPDIGNNIFSVRVTDAAGLTADGFLHINVTEPATFEDWQLVEFGPQAGEPLVAGESADPDEDGISNLLEYALGTDPNQPSDTHVEQEMVEIEGNDFMRITWFINPAAEDISLIVEGTTDPTNPASWSSAGIIVEQQTTARLVVRDTLGGPRRFFRLNISR
jgi:hypothetical protein